MKSHKELICGDDERGVFIGSCKFVRILDLWCAYPVHVDERTPQVPSHKHHAPNSRVRFDMLGLYPVPKLLVDPIASEDLKNQMIVRRFRAEIAKPPLLIILCSPDVSRISCKENGEASRCQPKRVNEQSIFMSITVNEHSICTPTDANHSATFGNTVRSQGNSLFT
ncbi:9719_t:CDS:2 [Acaulospora morrowiae]|uniref:9719_t:CDS:1 n=1 Tax=Acaulospora morrowiae TaxID=94023 RepID=A0A9N8ZSE2_9GLOM|nr:9719_t:CDS:2 [Acaulospora morrowiae]